jgi:hypothetical protein
MRSVLVGLIVGVTVAVAQAGLTGTWQGSTPNGATLVLDLTEKDATLTGTLTRNDEKVAIADGKVKGSTFSFNATLQEQKEAFSGEIKGDELRIWLDRRGPESAVTLARVKK